MNSLDAMLALCALLAGFGVLLFAVTGQKDYASEAMDSIMAKSAALSCAGVIDGIYSNGARGYLGQLACVPKDGSIYASQNGKTKSTPLIASAKKTAAIEVSVLDHYIN
jgi:hypothetical protein